MIEDKELGLKIAENPAEKMWIEIRDKTESRIKQMEESLIVERAFLKMSKDKIEEAMQDNSE